MGCRKFQFRYYI